MNEVDKWLPEELKDDELSEAIKPKVLIDQLKEVMFNMESVAKVMGNEYLTQKFTRRVESDYIGNDAKLRSISKKITNIKNAYLKAVEDLKKEVG